MIDSSSSSIKKIPFSSIHSPVPLEQPQTQAETRSWYSRFVKEPEKPGKEKWRDANLSEEERWKEWHKAKDREQRRGYVHQRAV
jgi:hypothetical protein